MSFRLKHIEAGKLLLEAGADLDIVNDDNLTAKDVATNSGEPDFVSWLDSLN